MVEEVVEDMAEDVVEIAVKVDVEDARIGDVVKVAGKVGVEEVVELRVVGIVVEGRLLGVGTSEGDTLSRTGALSMESRPWGY